MPNKVTKKAIAYVEKLLKTTPPEDLVNDPELQVPLMHVLYKTNSCGAIADLFTANGIKVSRQYVHKILMTNPHLAIKQTNTHRVPLRPLTPEKEAEILKLFDNGCTAQEIAKSLRVGFKRISEVVESNGRSFSDRPKVIDRKVKIGDRYGNWEVIDYAPRGCSLCRDVRNGIEKTVTNQSLLLGTSTGCRELAIVGRGASDRKAIAKLSNW